MKKKMKLSDLHVKSFVTNIKSQTTQTVKGGISGNHPGCLGHKNTKHIGCGQTMVLARVSDCCPVTDGRDCQTQEYRICPTALPCIFE